MLAVSLGMKYLEDRRKKSVSEMLLTVEGSRPAAVSKLLKDLEEPGRSPVRRVLDACNFTRSAEQRIQQAGLDWTPQQLATYIVVAALVGALLGFRFPLLLTRGITALVGAAVCSVLPYLFVRRKASKDLADPLGQEFRALFNEQNLGATIETALRNLTRRVPLLDARFFASAILLQRQTGGNLSEILLRLSHLIRERFRLKGQVKAASAHGRLTALILTVLPIATAFALLVVAPGYLPGMVADPDGRKLIMAAIGAQVLGNVCIRKIINIKV